MEMEAGTGRFPPERMPEGNSSGRGAAKRVRRALEGVERARRRLSAAGTADTPAQEWLLDNGWLARREGMQAVHELKRGRRLRRWKGGLYVEAVARTALERCPRCSPDELERFLSQVQEERPMTEAELALFIPALKGALCRELERLCRELELEDAPRRAQALFTALRTLSTTNLGPILERTSAVERILLLDPAGLYGKMDEATRQRYRHQVCRLARRYGLGEQETARRALSLSEDSTGDARHIGWFLFRTPLGETPRRVTGSLYVAAILLPTLLFTLWLSFRLDSWILFPLLLLPVSDVCKNVTDFLAIRLFPPRPVLKMSLEDGIPPEGRTLCVITCLLTDGLCGERYASLLERYRLSNRDSGKELRFGLLCDLPDRKAPMGGEQRAWVAGARQAVEALNRRYGGGFYLFFRPPVFQKTDECYVGWERKRGALLELVRLLRGRPSGLRVRAGDARALKGTRFVITLDSDTSLNVGAARELAGAMLHPLNRPVVDKKRRVVTQGYGLLQPRMDVDLRAANRSQFARIFAGQGGIDPYGGACSDVYHDLFNRGSYTGKAIFDVECFARCLDGRFPEERVLSHDLLEGAYLHAGLLGDVELTDGYPYRVMSYFSRLHRWVRGDWQILPWLGRTVRDERGDKVSNPICAVDKWKIFDNLRRSLSPIFTLLALLTGMCLSVPAFTTAGALAVVAAWSNLLLSGADLAFRGAAGAHRRYHSTVVAGFGAILLQTLLQLLFLPYQAFVCLSAVSTALWRSFVSHRRMLEWVTAADSEARKDGLLSHFRAQWPAVAVGVFCMAFARFPAGGAAGLIWAVSPAFAWAMSRPVGKNAPAPEEDRPFLLHEAGLIWRYFQDWLRQEDHWLPPDNVQEKPWLGPARRTSPTNIGMALLSCIAAVDLELTDRQGAVERIGHILDTLEGLEKWRGHLYNWYDTAEAVPLRPRYVSTVDSGNLRGSLIAMREALLEWGEEAMAARADALARAMDLRVLYDPLRKLFSIGYDVEKEEFTNGWYDLMASEARLSSYLAIALGEVDPRHWRRLGRMLAGVNDYCGMASWSGTMFEYFMPNLLLPCEQGSLMYESLSFCIYAQKRRGARTGTPWGISESGFYAFDPGMSYQYKAHGVQALGLKRGLDQELVVAPYASFLALLLAPRSAARNLRKLRNMGLEGTYGLYEAADFTPSRLHEGERWAVVRSFMSHHLGMSLVAIDNALTDNVMQRRFLRDSAMSAFRELLQEKVPVGEPIMKHDRGPAPEHIRPLRQSQFQQEGRSFDMARPACHLLSNGLVSALCTGAGAAAFTDDREETPILTCFRERCAPAGVSFFWKDAAGVLHDLMFAPFYREPEGRSWYFDGGGAAWSVKEENFSSHIRLTLPRNERGALWTVALHGCAGGELVAYLEPVLARRQDYLAHPAYSKLSLESVEFDRGITFTRRPRKGNRRSALAIAWDGEAGGWDTERRTALGRGGLRRLAQALEGQPHNSAGAVLDPCLLVRFPVEGERFSLRLALGFEDNAEQAERTALAVCSAPEQVAGRLDGLLRRLQMTVPEGRQAMELLSWLAFPPKGRKTLPQSALWPYGISGDVPIALAAGEENSDLVLKLHALLSGCGFAFDLVFLLEDGGDYRRPRRTALTEALKSLGMESALGRKGGVHLVDCADASAAVLRDWAAVELDGEGHWAQERRDPPVLPPLLPCRLTERLPVWDFLPGGEFILTLPGALPPLGWSHFLVNPRFGWLTDETGCGHIWRGNAREGQLTAWNNDPLAIGGPEFFLLTWHAQTHSLFADGDGCCTEVTYGFGWMRWVKQWQAGEVRTTAFVPWEGERRLLLVELHGKGELLHMISGHTESRFTIEDRLLLCTDPEGTHQASEEEWNMLFEKTAARWRDMVRPLQVDSPDKAMNHYLNGWCLYQILACRLLARTSRYQNGGAFGFRDQLQDALAMLLFAPERMREQILRCCAHQFLEGDVQHWWHEAGEEKARGVRTRISDDLLWLPYGVSRYVETWGDWALLDVQVNYLSGDPLQEGEDERYFSAQVSQERNTVYGHALNAIRCALERGVGEHGLMKMGTGDWNDGMDRVGRKGKGESVWLTWFTAVVLQGFAPISDRMGDAQAAQLCRDWAETLTQAAAAAWDGAWYLRGWYDSGQPLGSRRSEECQIDSIAQSWAVFTQGSDAGKNETALRAALERLFDRERGLVKLFTPAFDAGGADPGYIRGYLPGVRENGGQYTHAAVWLALACFEADMAQEGYDILHAILPETHPAQAYLAEPWVLAGDVYANPGHLGRGGWSWYTGAAGWYLQTALAGLFGITVKEGRLMVQPRLPGGWGGCRLRWQGRRWNLDIRLKSGKVSQLRLDGRPVDFVELEKLEGEHTLDAVGPES